MQFYTFVVSKEINADNRNVTQDKREKIMFDIRKNTGRCNL